MRGNKRERSTDRIWQWNSREDRGAELREWSEKRRTE